MRGVAARLAAGAAVSVGLLVAGRRWRGFRMSPSMSHVDNPIHFEEDLWTRVQMYAHVHAWYLLLLFAPVWSCADWGYNVLPQPEYPVLAAAAYAIVFGTPLAFLRSGRREKVVLCTVLLVIPFLPASGVVPVGTVLAERLLLIPSTGFMMGAGVLYDYLAGEEVEVAVCGRAAPVPPIPAARGGKKAKAKAKDQKAPVPPTPAAEDKRTGSPPAPRVMLLQAGLLAVLAWYASLTLKYSHAWHSPRTLYDQGLADCPTSAKGNLQRGSVDMQEDKWEQGLAR